MGKESLKDIARQSESPFWLFPLRGGGKGISSYEDRPPLLVLRPDKCSAVLPTILLVLRYQLLQGRSTRPEMACNVYVSSDVGIESDFTIHCNG